jgi:hypothetical protein
MTMTEPSADEGAIRALITRQFASLSWAEQGGPDWRVFRADFLDAATLFPSARPLRPVTPDEFEARMAALVGTSLRSFEEEILGCRITVFGHIAVAIVGCEACENGEDRVRTVEMMLLVKDAGRWSIAAQAWDKEAPGRRGPDLVED